MRWHAALLCRSSVGGPCRLPPCWRRPAARSWGRWACHPAGWMFVYGRSSLLLRFVEAAVPCSPGHCNRLVGCSAARREAPCTLLIPRCLLVAHASDMPSPVVQGSDAVHCTTWMREGQRQAGQRERQGTSGFPYAQPCCRVVPGARQLSPVVAAAAKRAEPGAMGSRRGAHEKRLAEGEALR